MPRERIHKVLSSAGVASRRAVEEMILEGRITVNGQAVERLPCFIDPASDDVRVDGRRVRLGRSAKKVYYLLNKPRGVVCTQSDPRGRPRAVDLVPAATQRVYCVGRLDVESTGLIVLTNDGELTQTLTHPSNQVVKTYVVQVDGRVSGARLEQIKAGVYLDGKRTQHAAVKVLRRSDKQSLLEIRLSEGRNREIRRVLARMGHRVRRLKRVAIGRVTDRGLKIGNWRILGEEEIPRLMAHPVVRETSGSAKPAGKGRSPGGKRTAPKAGRGASKPRRSAPGARGGGRGGHKSGGAGKPRRRGSGN